MADAWNDVAKKMYFEGAFMNEWHVSDCLENFQLAKFQSDPKILLFLQTIEKSNMIADDSVLDNNFSKIFNNFVNAVRVRKCFVISRYVQKGIY